MDSFNMVFNIRSCSCRFANQVTLSVLPRKKDVYRKYSVRVRFAPSPTGYLHLGSLRTALYNYLYAKKHNGKFILRIEDTDRERFVPGATEHIIDVLKWIGINPDEGPFIGGEFGPYIQSERLELYREKLQILLQNGRAYRCFCSKKRNMLIKKDASLRGGIPTYDNACRHLSEKEIEQNLKNALPYVVRLKLKPIGPFKDMVYGPIDYDVSASEGDPILMRSDHTPTYHFSNVIDDHCMGITHVLRGVEWQVSTPKHLLLYEAFGWKPPKFGHFSLIMKNATTKLSKRHNDSSVEYYRNKNYKPECLVKYVTLVGGGFKDTSDNGTEAIDELAKKFDIEKVTKYSSQLDPHRLEVVNKNFFFKEFDENPASVIQDVKKCVSEHLRSSSRDDSKPVNLSDSYIRSILEWSKDGRISNISELYASNMLFLWIHPSEHYILSELKTNKQFIPLLHRLINFLNSNNSSITINEMIKTETNYKLKEVMPFLRSLICGQKTGPPVGELLQVLGKEIIVERLQRAAELSDSNDFM